MIKALTLLITSAFIAGCSQFTERSTGYAENELTPCPAWPRCVSSQAGEDAKKVAAFHLQEPIDLNWEKVADVVEALPRTTVVTLNERYLHAEVSSPWGVYTDDLELLLASDSPRLEVRSSGRIGYYDFDVNRDRVEALRARLQEEQLIH